LTCEAMMGDGKALQMGTSHELGQNFARAFDIDFLDESGTLQHAWTTSWGVSTRLVGGLIMCHGDDHGLRVPPRLASVQVVVLAVRDEAGVVDRCRELTEALRRAGVRAVLDAATDISLGRRATDWELKGVPLRLELGPRDLADNEVTLVRRVSSSKEPVSLDGVVEALPGVLEEQQRELHALAVRRQQERTIDVAGLDEAADAAASGWARLPWAEVGETGEARLAEQGVTVRCLLAEDGSVPESGDEADLLAVVARAY
jgi:prolyl-tRNA synthetase